MKKLYILLSLALVSVTSSAQVVISQIYGAGGNNGATYTHDFVELFNRGNAAVTMTGYTLQYASATGTFNASNIQTLPTITIQPGKYYLIQQAGGTNGVALPATPDLVTTTTNNFVVLALAASNGKLALVNNTTAIVAPTDSNVVDYVGFGTATAFEGSGPAPAPSVTTSVLRNNNGCTDTNDNTANFTAGTIVPRNSATAANLCSTASVGENQIAGLRVYPNPVSNGTLYISTDSNSVKTVAIFDVLGKQVVNTKATESVNVSNLKGGVYIVKITEEGKTATRKLVIK